MSEKKNLSVQVLILDADCNPIKNLPYRLYFNGAMIAAETGEDGLTKKIRTPSPDDEVQVAIERIDKSIKIVARVIAGAGSKLVTLVSPRIKVVSPTLPHAVTTPGQVPSKKDNAPPAYDLRETKSPTVKKEFGPIPQIIQNKDGNAVSKVEGDIPNLEFLDEFNGEEMAEDDYLSAAKKLGVEYAAIKAFAIVESKGVGFVKLWNKTLPKILYERHKFAEFTNNVFSRINPDISLPCGYYNKEDLYVLADDSHKKKRKIPEDLNYYRALSKKDDEETRIEAMSFENLVKHGKVDRNIHAYFDRLGSYKRLVKAYKLNPTAALESCSWGSFQIMGEYWKEMGYASVTEFTKSMSRSPKEQIKAFILYIERVNPKIKDYLYSLDWEAAARAYNGPKYAVNKYHIKLEEAYEKFKQERS